MHRTLRGVQLHDLVGPAALTKQAGHDLHRGVDMVEEELVAGTQVVEPGLASRGRDEPVTRALTVAGEQNVTIPTILGQAVQLVLPERPLLLRGNQLHHGRLPDVP